ncbi:MAG: hypothetical protein PHD67_09640, partial [Oscillospiraceae bacterium]|nr:hypothetical protein [Oscillospiraceae bacterium]
NGKKNKRICPNIKKLFEGRCTVGYNNRIAFIIPLDSHAPPMAMGNAAAGGSINRIAVMIPSISMPRRWRWAMLPQAAA